MAETFKERKPRIESDVVEFMSEFARHLIAAGISAQRFSAISRLAYFVAASDLARFGNDRLNQSSVAAMTGLTRVQVRQFAKQERPRPSDTRDRFECLIEGWATDPSFTDARFEPRRLRAVGGGKGFPALAKKYGGDVPARALLRELQRHKLVSLRNGYVSLNRLGSRGRNEYRLRLVSRVLCDLIKDSPETVVHSPIRTINLETRYPIASDKGRVLIQKRAEEGLRNFLSGLQAAGTAASIASPRLTGRGKRVTRARLVLVTEDVDS